MKKSNKERLNELLYGKEPKIIQSENDIDRSAIKPEVVAIKSNLKMKIIIVALAMLFAYFVWPTPYKYFRYMNTTMRVNRITQTAEYYSGSRGWVSSEKR